MKLGVEELGPVPKRCEFEVDSGSDVLSDVPAKFESPIRAVMDLKLIDGVIRCHGSLEGIGSIECFRCLKPVERRIETDFEAGFSTADSEKETVEREISITDMEVSVLPEGVLDLEEVVREQILLSLSDSVLCRDSCKGICYHCGKDLNETACECGSNEIDPRWKGLESLKKDLKN